MLTEFQRRKIHHVFTIYDIDGNGRITKDDYEHYLARLANALGWQADTPHYKEFFREMMGQWEQLRMADFDGDEAVTDDEYRAFMDAVLTQSVTAGNYSAFDGVTDLWFATFDSNQDGKLTAEDYQRMLLADGFSDVDGTAYFQRFDADGDGYLSKEDVNALHQQFWWSDDPDALGNFILGPLN